MQFPISDFNGNRHNIETTNGQVFFVTGKNGSGKSTLILDWAKSNPSHPVLTGNREVSFKDSTVSLSPREMQKYEGYTQSNLDNNGSRTTRAYHNDQSWLSTLIARLDAYENHCMREANKAYKAQNHNKAKTWEDRNPIEQINQVFDAIGLGLALSIDEKKRYHVSKPSHQATYGIDKMSDGERAALILISNAILAETNTSITVDEPERHMHRSVSSPLLRELFRRRQDLTWVIATHDVAILRDFSDAQLLVLYGYNGKGWQFDLLNSTHDIPDGAVDAIYGAREKVLFVEGDEQKSLDLPLYQVLFPDTTILPKGSCNEVRRSVEALNSVGALNSMTARGLVDADNRDDDTTLTAKLGVYAIESLYFHPDVVQAVAETMGLSDQIDSLLQEACEQVTDNDLQTCARNCAEHALRAQFRSNPPQAFKAS